MAKLNKLLLTLLACLLIGGVAQAQTARAGQTPSGEVEPQTVTFRFVAGKDMFYIPYGGNDSELNRLYALVDEYRAEITAGRMPVYVEGYCASLESTEENFKTAVIRSNRVKSELITNKGLVEKHFTTKNHASTYTALDGKSHRDMVVVMLRIPAKVEPVVETKPEPVVEKQPEPQPERKPESQPEPVVEKQPEPPVIIPEPAPAYSRWSIGADIGMPFFWGDMTSLSADKTYIGVSAGLQGTYQLNPLLGVSLSLSWAQNKAGSRDYAKAYLLDPAGMTWYTPQPGTTVAYGDLYSKINMFSAGLHLDVNVLRMLGPRMANGHFKLILSPAVYAQHFSSKAYTKSDDKVYTGNRLSKDLSLGLGGDVAVRYNLSPAIDLQLKGTGVWITDNLFDNIRTVGYVKQNAMWGVSAGVVWKIAGKHSTNLMYKKK